MKHKHILAVGLALGLGLGSSLQTFGLAAVENITAQINRQYRFDFDGERVALPDGYEVLVYQDRTYVPARFVAEQLGAEVLWNEDTKLISINQPAPSPSEEEKTESQKDKDTEKNTTIAYQSLPAYTENIDVKVTVTFDVDDNYGKKIYLIVENKTDDPMVMDASKVKAIVNGKEVDLLGTTATDRDYGWYEGITKKDETKEGYIRIPSSVKDPQEISFELPIRFEGARVREISVPIHFKLS